MTILGFLAGLFLAPLVLSLGIGVAVWLLCRPDDD